MNKNILPDAARQEENILAFDYLKTFIVTLVVFHHSILAYTTFFTFNNSYLVAGIIPYTNLINPIIDSTKWKGFDLMVIFNDTFFMSLLFFISGFFVWKSLERKGIRKFLYERLLRLGVPFIIGVPLIAPLSYYSAHLQNALVTGESIGYIEFWSIFAKTNFFTSGPLWFLWVLLLFNLIIVLLFKIIPNLDNKIKSLPKSLFNKTTVLVGSLMIVSMLAFFSLTFLFDLNAWSGIGPFVLQPVRILHYFVYFVFGVLIGTYGIDKTRFHLEGNISKYWWLFIGLGTPSALLLIPISRITYPISCILIVLGVIGFFLCYTKENIGIVDNLSKNIYGIYIFHYIFTSWLQFFFLGIQIPAIMKGTLVFIGSFLLSWALTILIRRIPIVARFI